MFKNALVRLPSKNLALGISNSFLGIPDYNLAMEQQEAHINALGQVGLEVRVLDAMESYPDAVFIEDICLCTPHCAVITRPGAKSRRGEARSFDRIIADYYQNVHFIEAPSTLDAGDVMMVGQHYYIGISNRTNLSGAQQLINFLQLYDLNGSVLYLSDYLHLKTAVSYLEHNCLLVDASMSLPKTFSNFDKIVVNKNESYAANSVWVNDRVLVPSGHEDTLKKVQDKGYVVLQLNVSEYQKLDGGLSCLSLRF